ncbi:MAG: D-glycero-beta-D-manno-heptose 1,7-bisphosphate 7-phosphatase [Alphaproteobacteria bacterium]|nr:D-glycero-beta-D-manno-heptose 1,7-bisphosphate 7-phosphatase [Alphaproteobacteria bacterium]
MVRRFVLLDRDGTINVDTHYLSHPDQLDLLPGAVAGLKRMREMGLGLVVLTNQSGVGRGYFDHATVDAVHERLRAMLRAEGVEIDGIYVCPHAPDEDCACRKPLPGMIETAAARHGFDPAESFMIGDKVVDIDLGRSVGASTILVRTGYGAEVERQGKAAADHVVDSLIEAAEVIARGLSGKPFDTPTAEKSRVKMGQRGRKPL